jgi:hypothetical protein
MGWLGCGTYLIPSKARVGKNLGCADMMELPLWLWFAGAALLGILLAYGILRNRTRTPQERAVTNEATKELYRQEDRSN